MLHEVILLISGLLLLYLGAEGLVRGSAQVANRFGIPPLIIGLTIVAFGTSAPELVVSVNAALRGGGDIALGNVIGSNIANIAVILGLSALIHPLKVTLQVLRRDVPWLIGATLLFLLLFIDRKIGHIEAIVLFSGMVFYLFHSISTSRKELCEENVFKVKKGGTFFHEIVFIVVGLSLLVFGSRLFVDGSIALARILGVSEAVIGLTIVAAGTSLPELATSVVASLRKNADIAVGNIVGSNIFNIFCILGVAGTVKPLYGNGIQTFDMLSLLVFTLLLLPFMWSKFILSRTEGAILLLLYSLYLFRLWPR